MRRPSPSDSHLRVVAEHEPVRARLHGHAIDPDVAPDETVDDAVGEIAQARTLEHDAVLDLRPVNLHILADGGDRSHVRLHDSGVAPDDRRPPDRRTLHGRASLEHDLALDAALGVDAPLDPRLDSIQDQPVRLQHVLQSPGVLPPAVHDVRLDGEAAIDEVLDRIGDLQLVAKAGLDALNRLEHVGPEHVDTDEGQIAHRLDRLLDQAHHEAVAQLGDAERLGIGHLRQQDLGRWTVALELPYEAPEVLVQEVVAQIHDERLV